MRAESRGGLLMGAPFSPRGAGVPAQQAAERQQHEAHPPLGGGGRAGAEAERSRGQVGGRGTNTSALLTPTSCRAPEGLSSSPGSSRTCLRGGFSGTRQLCPQPCCSRCSSPSASPLHPVSADSFCLDLFPGFSCWKWMPEVCVSNVEKLDILHNLNFKIL